jgi:hypothetical protein
VEFRVRTVSPSPGASKPSFRPRASYPTTGATSGFSVHAEQLVFDDEPEKLEKFASYLTRAPIRLGSITETAEGRVSVTTPPHPLTGNTVLLLDPLDWMHAICQQIIPGE